MDTIILTNSPINLKKTNKFNLFGVYFKNLFNNKKKINSMNLTQQQYNTLNLINSGSINIDRLLDIELIQSFLVSNKTAIDNILFPALIGYFSSNKIKENEKNKKLNELKMAISNCNKFIENEKDVDFNEYNRKLDVLIYFKNNVNAMIKPYKI